MNKTELIEKIAAGASLTKADSKKALDATIAAITEALKKGDKVQLVGFGTFDVIKEIIRRGTFFTERPSSFSYLFKSL